MIRKYLNHKPQTTLWHREKEPLNHLETPGRLIKQSNQLSLPHQDDCNTRTDTKQRTTKHRTITDSHNGSNNKQKSQQQQNHSLRTDSSLSHGGGGLNAFYWYQIFALEGTTQINISGWVFIKGICAHTIGTKIACWPRY